MSQIIVGKKEEGFKILYKSINFSTRGKNVEKINYCSISSSTSIK